MDRGVVILFAVALVYLVISSQLPCICEHKTKQGKMLEA